MLNPAGRHILEKLFHPMKTRMLYLLPLLALAGCSSVPPTRPVNDWQDSRINWPDVVTLSSHDRAEGFRNIAEMPEIPEADLLRIVQLLRFRNCGSTETREVLLAILHNKAATNNTRRMISGCLPELGLFPVDRQAVTTALTS